MSDSVNQPLEQFQTYVIGLIYDELDNIEKGNLPKSKSKPVDVNKDTIAVSTATEMGEEEMAAKTVKEEVVVDAVEFGVDTPVEEAVVSEEKAPHPDTHDEDGNLVIIGHARKFLYKVTSEDGHETLYGSSVVASEWLGLTPATIRTRARKPEYIDELGRLWEEISLVDYNQEQEALNNE